MALRYSVRTALGCAAAVAVSMAAAMAAGPASDPGSPPVALGTTRISIAGTSNIHAYSASTTTVRLTRVQVADGVARPRIAEEIVKPGALEAFEIAIPAATLSSPKEGLDKNMHKALNVKEHPEITFRLLRLEPRADAPDAFRAAGILRIAGVERQVVLEITTSRQESAVIVKGEVQLLMTDFGITPPKAMLGMLKTDPKVTVTFETSLVHPLT